MSDDQAASSTESPEIDRLREDCAQAHLAVFSLAERFGYLEMPNDDPRAVQLTKLLDNLHAAAEGDERPHADLIPFGWQDGTKIPTKLRSAVDELILSKDAIAAYLGPNRPPASSGGGDIVAHYNGPGPAQALAVALNAIERMVPEWDSYLAEIAPQPSGGRARTSG
jgi:hypothetical protein